MRNLEVSLEKALDTASELFDALPEHDNPQYVKGQAELVLDLFDLEPADLYREVVTEAISGHRDTRDAIERIEGMRVMTFRQREGGSLA